MDCDGEGRTSLVYDAHTNAYLDFLHRVVVVHAQVHVVRARDHPLLADDELGAPHRHLAHLEALHHGL